MIDDVNNIKEQNDNIEENVHVNEQETSTEVLTPQSTNNVQNQQPSMVMGDKPMNFVERMFALIFKHGFFKTICAVLLILSFVMLWQFINALNYNKIAEQVVQELVEKQIQNKEAHEEGSALRLANNPKIAKVLTKILYELDADRVSILEMHNGKENPSDLPFVYCDMTYEETKDRIPYVSDEYDQMNMGKYHFFNHLMQERIFVGKTEDIWSIDKKFASKVQTNDTQYVAMVVIKNEVEIGFLAVSWLQPPTMDKHKIEVKLTDFAQELGYLLDMTPKSTTKTK